MDVNLVSTSQHLHDKTRTYSWFNNVVYPVVRVYCLGKGDFTVRKKNSIRIDKFG